jgi:alpha-L-fucosidase 2
MLLADGQPYTIALSPTVDRVLLAELFDVCIRASVILGVDEGLRSRWQELRDHLPPYRVGKYGQLQEWYEDYEEARPGHRHTSHLLGLYPLAQITPQDTPELAQAARVALERRLAAPGYEEGAWARNNTTLFYARLRDAEASYRSLMVLLGVEADTNLFAGTRLAPAHAYELDYNTGASAGIAEMLLQSHRGMLELLPALPLAWPQGSAAGLRARGGFEVDLSWSGGRLQQASITAAVDGPCRVFADCDLAAVYAGVQVDAACNRGLLEFTAAAGKTYVLYPLEFIPGFEERPDD